MRILLEGKWSKPPWDLVLRPNAVHVWRAGLQVDDPVGDVLEWAVARMGVKDRGPVLIPEGPQQAAHDLDGLGVDVGGGLVQEHGLRGALASMKNSEGSLGEGQLASKEY